MKSIQVGIIGFGVVGSGVYHILRLNQQLIQERKGIEIQIKAICDLDPEKVKHQTIDVTVTNNWQELVDDKSIDVIIELIGGIQPAKKIISAALKAGKSIVTANKKLLAEEGSELFALEAETNGRIFYEAAVGGGIPCIMGLRDGLVANNFRSIMGILNGTTNYILTKMVDQGLSFADALRDAQTKGFAEADPTFDIEGYDAGHKILLLASMAYGLAINYKSVSIEGITGVRAQDIIFAEEMGYSIKLLGIARMTEKGLDLRVHPTMIPKTHYLATVKNENNAVLMDGEMTGPVIFYGKGAGSLPTASAVVSDLVQIANLNDDTFIAIKQPARLIGTEDRLLRYYLRIQTQDHPGILSKISGVLGDNHISISSVLQKEAEDATVPLIIVTHEAPESAIHDAVKKIEAFDFVYESVMILRVEDL